MSKSLAILVIIVALVTFVSCLMADFSYAGDLPVREEGRLIVFQSSSMRCALYVNESGTTHGTAVMSCVDLPWDPAIDNSIKLLDVRKTVEAD